MCGLRQAVHIQLFVEEGNGKPPLLICIFQVYDGTSAMTMPSWTCLRADNSSSSSSAAAAAENTANQSNKNKFLNLFSNFHVTDKNNCFYTFSIMCGDICFQVVRLMPPIELSYNYYSTGLVSTSSPNPSQKRPLP